MYSCTPSPTYFQQVCRRPQPHSCMRDVAVVTAANWCRFGLTPVGQIRNEQLAVTSCFFGLSFSHFHGLLSSHDIVFPSKQMIGQPYSGTTATTFPGFRVARLHTEWGRGGGREVHQLEKLPEAGLIRRYPSPRELLSTCLSGSWFERGRVYVVSVGGRHLGITHPIRVQ